jgi:hypothetical protein
MSALTAAVIDRAISLVAGVLATLLGFRLLGPRPDRNPGYDAFHRKWAKHLRWIGPLLIVLALIQIGWVVLGR